MPPRKKKIAELIQSELPLENEVDTVETDLIETVESALTLAVKNLSDANDIATTATNELSEQVEAATEQVEAATEQVEAAKEELVSLLDEQISHAKEEAASVVSDAAAKITTDIQNVIVVMTSKTLAEMLLESVNSQKNLNVVISKTASNLITNIVSSMPNMLDNIKKSLFEVIKDGKIDSNDIPHFITIIQDLYEIVYTMKEFKFDNKVRATICGEVLKYISHFLILDDQIQVAKVNQEIFLNQIDRLIDSCVGLLTFQASFKIKGCLSFLHK
jgi:hypothetical protein